MTIQRERWPSVKTPECLRKCDQDSADHQSDFTSFFSFFNLGTNRHAAVSVPVYCGGIQVSVDWNSSIVLQNTTSSRSLHFGTQLRRGSCLEHMLTPSGPALSYLNNDVIIFVSPLPLSPEFLSRVKVEFWGTTIFGLDEAWYTLLLMLRTVSQMTRRILKARPDVITVESFAGDGAYCCRFQCGIKSTENSEEKILIWISGFWYPPPFLHVIIIPLFPHLQVRRHKWRPGVRAWKCSSVSP